MKHLGINTLLVSNASGALNLDYKKGELMLIEDHINLQGGSPLAFKGVEQLGERFVDMSAPYDATLNTHFESIALKNNITLHKGVYVSVVGPQLETRAEYKMLRLMGAEAVGMSTVPEVIVARHANMRVLGLSLITNMSTGISKTKLSHQEVLETSKKTLSTVSRLLTGFVNKIQS